MLRVKRKQDAARRLWTKDELYRLHDLGFFNHQQVQLIEGEILVMASQKDFHAIGVELTAVALRAAFGPNYWVRVQTSLDLTPLSVPDPDLAVVPGAVRTHDPNFNPTTALLIVEVSDTSLRLDRGRKANLYARCGIADYWILNIPKHRLEVYRNPVADATKRFGHAYAGVTHLGDGDVVSPLALPGAAIPVASLLP